MGALLFMLVVVLLSLLWTAVAVIVWAVHFSDYTHIEQIGKQRNKYLAVFLGGPIVWLFYFNYLYHKHVK